MDIESTMRSSIFLLYNLECDITKAVIKNESKEFHSPNYYLGCGWDKVWVVMVDSAVDVVEGSTLLSRTIE